MEKIGTTLDFILRIKKIFLTAALFLFVLLMIGIGISFYFLGAYTWLFLFKWLGWLELSC
jgi:hypothetical protein